MNRVGLWIGYATDSKIRCWTAFDYRAQPSQFLQDVLLASIDVCYSRFVVLSSHYFRGIQIEEGGPLRFQLSNVNSYVVFSELLRLFNVVRDLVKSLLHRFLLVRSRPPRKRYLGVQSKGNRVT